MNSMVTVLIVLGALISATYADCVARASSSSSSDSSSAMAQAFSTAVSDVKFEVDNIQGTCTETQVQAIAFAQAHAIATAVASAQSDVFAVVEGDENCQGRATAMGYAEAKGIAFAAHYLNMGWVVIRVHQSHVLRHSHGFGCYNLFCLITLFIYLIFNQRFQLIVFT
eukprot:TRINITY_DN653_c0_g1_i1.p1 TRINITY_DN653_c0_g1~~TRINITY_DN653_c0_g1_i1.p1  ORF type:complete len:168 (+),score=6.03 TRINITY_DN653_c0_g1_i1:164-667(+)